MDFDNAQNQAEALFDSIEAVEPVGADLLPGKLFDEIGFNVIASPLLKPLVLSRIIYPTSKLKITDYWQQYHGIEVKIDEVYRYLDKLHEKEKHRIEQISFQHTQRIMGSELLQMVFYDVTTIYFEAEEDDLRKTGFSKDGKTQHPQMVLGLLVSRGGYPLAYDIFEGNKYEGDTLLPVINSFKARYGFEQITIIADAGLMSKANIEELEKNKHH